MTAYRLAKDTGLPLLRVNEIVNERRSITAETDLHLCGYFGEAPGYWLRVQLAYHLRAAQHANGAHVRVAPGPKGLVRPLQSLGHVSLGERANAS